MRKLLSICIATVMSVSMSFAVMAASGGFISSPSGNQAPELIDFYVECTVSTVNLSITSYAQRNSLPEDTLLKLEKAYNDIVNTVDLTKLNAELESIAKEQKIPTARLAVSDMFDISMYGCDEHEEHGRFYITLKPESLEHFVCLLHLRGEKWEIVKGAEVQGEYLVFDIEDLSPFAIVVDGGEDYVNPPQTGDNSHIPLYIIIMVISSIALAVLIGKRRKNNV